MFWRTRPKSPCTNYRAKAQGQDWSSATNESSSAENRLPQRIQRATANIHAAWNQASVEKAVDSCRLSLCTVDPFADQSKAERHVIMPMLDEGDIWFP